MQKLPERTAKAGSRLSEGTGKCACEPAAGNGRTFIRVKDVKERYLTLNLGGTTAQSSLRMIVSFILH